MNLSRACQQTALRVSFSRWNQRSEVWTLAEAVEEGLRTLAAGSF